MREGCESRARCLLSCLAYILFDNRKQKLCVLFCILLAYLYLCIQIMNINENPGSSPLSIVIIVHNQAEAIEQNLSLFLSLDYDAPYEVIVVNDASTDETPDVLKRLKSEHERLYTTFMPVSVPNPSRRQLTLSIGIKAAHHPYVMLADINRPPTSSSWLQNLPTAGAEAILTYNIRKRKGNDTIHWAMSQLDEAYPYVVKAERRSGTGHRGHWLKMWRGHYDALTVRRDKAFNLIRHFDQNISLTDIIKLRCIIAWKYLF